MTQLSFFEQVPFRSMVTLLRYLCAKNVDRWMDGQTDRRLFSFIQQMMHSSPVVQCSMHCSLCTMFCTQLCILHIVFTFAQYTLLQCSDYTLLFIVTCIIVLFVFNIIHSYFQALITASSIVQASALTRCAYNFYLEDTRECQYIDYIALSLATLVPKSRD